MVAVRLSGCKHGIAMLVVVVACLVALSCGDEATGSRTTPQTSGPSNAYLIPPSDLKAVMAAAGQDERGFLSDGTLTFTEYEKAVFNLVRCGEERGLSFGTGPVLRQWGEYQFQATWTSSLEDGQGALDDCRARNFSEVQRLWARVAQPTQKDYEEAYASLSECLRAAGLEVSRQPSAQELAALGRRLAGVSDQFSNCAVAMQDEYGIYVTERRQP